MKLSQTVAYNTPIYGIISWKDVDHPWEYLHNVTLNQEHLRQQPSQGKRPETHCYDMLSAYIYGSIHQMNVRFVVMYALQAGTE